MGMILKFMIQDEKEVSDVLLPKLSEIQSDFNPSLKPHLMANLKLIILILQLLRSLRFLEEITHLYLEVLQVEQFQ